MEMMMRKNSFKQMDGLEKIFSEKVVKSEEWELFLLNFQTFVRLQSLFKNKF